jgi:hypothetical protein
MVVQQPGQRLDSQLPQELALIKLWIDEGAKFDGPLFQYAIRAVPPIHIIVRNGQVTLEGVAANEMDRNIANIQAHSVPGVFSIAQNIAVEKQ